MADEYLPKPQTDLPTPELDLPLPEKELPAHIESEGNKKSVILKSFILGFIFVVILAGIAGAYLLGKNNSSQNVYKTEISSPSPTPDPTTNWNTYKGSDFSVKYNPSWQVNADNDFGATSIFDPNSWSEKIGQGGGGGNVGGPSKYFTIQIINSSLTVKQYVDKTLSGDEYLSIKNPERQILNLDTYSGEIFKNSGEGSDGYIVVLSNNNGKIATINVPYSSPKQDQTTWDMLNTFQFTDSMPGTPIPTGQSSEMGSQSEAILNAGN